MFIVVITGTTEVATSITNRSPRRTTDFIYAQTSHQTNSSYDTLYNNIIHSTIIVCEIISNKVVQPVVRQNVSCVGRFRL
jgi:hypothetical protein